MVRVVAGLLLLVVSTTAAAVDVVNVKLMTLDLAVDIAQAAVEACRKDGYQVSVVVVDRSGRTQVVMRDIYANQYMTQLAKAKTSAVVLSNTSSSLLGKNRADIAAELNQLDDLLVLDGAVPITVAGSMIGAVGVSGAPGGHLDERCAQQALDKLSERIEFSD